MTQPKAWTALLCLFLSLRSWMILLHVLVALCLGGWWEHHRFWVWHLWCWPVCGWVITMEASLGMAQRRSSTCTLCAWCWGWSSCKAMVSPHTTLIRFRFPPPEVKMWYIDKNVSVSCWLLFFNKMSFQLASSLHAHVICLLWGAGGWGGGAHIVSFEWIFIILNKLNSGLVYGTACKVRE